MRVHACACVCLCASVCCGYLGKPERGIRFPGFPVIGGCELFSLRSGTSVLVLWRSRQLVLLAVEASAASRK